MTFVCIRLDCFLPLLLNSIFFIMNITRHVEWLKGLQRRDQFRGVPDTLGWLRCRWGRGAHLTQFSLAPHYDLRMWTCPELVLKRQSFLAWGLGEAHVQAFQREGWRYQFRCHQFDRELGGHWEWEAKIYLGIRPKRTRIKWPFTRYHCGGKPEGSQGNLYQYQEAVE